LPYQRVATTDNSILSLSFTFFLSPSASITSDATGKLATFDSIRKYLDIFSPADADYFHGKYKTNDLPYISRYVSANKIISEKKDKDKTAVKKLTLLSE